MSLARLLRSFACYIAHDEAETKAFYYTQAVTS